MPYTKKGDTRNGNTVNDEGRTCTHCKEFKQWDLYSRNKNLPYGKANICKACNTIIGKAFRDKRDAGKVEADLAKKRMYHAMNKDASNERNKAHYYKTKYLVDPVLIRQKKDEGCELCGTHHRVQVDSRWIGDVHVLCNLCRVTVDKYDNPEYTLQILRNFTIQQAIRKGLH